MSQRTEEQNKAILDQINSLNPEIRVNFVNTASINAITNLLFKKGILTKEEMDEEFFDIAEKRIKEL